ncbi:RsiV family protein [Rhodococcus sp. Q]|uniref:RsiV family protein n=1 Tax=Rhodococcus sp. Q TaxID=2502252 RepID=UPI0010F76DA7|nr:RsiV family protein [Rhodococcus sp. Q]
MSISRILAVPLAAVVLVGGSACSDDPDDAASTPGVTTTARVTSVSPTVREDPEAGYSATSTQVTGDTGRVRYDVTVPQVEGGDPAVAAEFNESMRAALQDQIDGSSGERFTLDSRTESGVTHIGSRVLSGLLVTSWNADPPGAHPTPLVATVVVDTDNGRPITLNTLFPDLQAGLDRLSEESARLLPGTAAGAEFERSGIEPTRQNFSNWLATPEGMEIHFSDYQVGPHAVGLVEVTAPWDRLQDVMAPAMVGVVSS